MIEIGYPRKNLKTRKSPMQPYNLAQPRFPYFYSIIVYVFA